MDVFTSEWLALHEDLDILDANMTYTHDGFTGHLKIASNDGNYQVTCNSSLPLDARHIRETIIRFRTQLPRSY